MNIKVATFTVMEKTINTCQLNGVPSKKTCLDVWRPGKTITSLLSYRDKNVKVCMEQIQLMNFLNFQRTNNKDADQTEDVQAGLFPFFVVTCMMFVYLLSFC